MKRVIVLLCVFVFLAGCTSQEEKAAQTLALENSQKYEMAVGHYESKEWDKALELFIELEGYKDVDEMSIDAKYELAKEYYELGRFEYAKRLFESISSNKGVNTYLNNLNILISAQGFWEFSDGMTTEQIIIEGWNYTEIVSIGMSYHTRESGKIQLGRHYLKIAHRDCSTEYVNQLRWMKNDQLYRRYTRSKTEKIIQPKTPPQIGMTAQEVKDSTWGEPQKVNRTTTQYGTREQWVYSMNRYVYLDNGVVTAIQD
ncbi:hypothetical protein EDC18_102398 [Natranaerovirga pectinivora]|uniref:Tetratricopeptide repeat protein n=1 Tax=Natranaerovirga pectinivora TaxID=682400 RepID=A0A4R3MN12_9FIRM|nr:hypothetical protein [Natranaerovirga pectinivora]TCT16379.1 hypothetical protein EDC18_102398 [Natranaerovirga pectinivora]